MSMPGGAPSRSKAFTLIELSFVVIILALLAGAALRYAAAQADANNTAATNASLDVVETALLNFRMANNRLPCPTAITTQENSANFGLEAGAISGGIGTGECRAGMTPQADFVNSGADPNNGESAYDSTCISAVEAGGIPTKTLKIADKYAYDAWGRKILYVVDRRITAINAFVTYPATAVGTSGNIPGVIVLKKNAGDSLANAISYYGMYALVSFGKNGHGGYLRSLNTADSNRWNAGSTNTDEQKNCHCDSTATATSFDRDFVQKARTAGSTTLTDTFDDIVRFKTRGELTSSVELQ